MELSSNVQQQKKIVTTRIDYGNGK